ncbi:MAG: hypothetical protein M3462_02000 [Chloroflexota bacterium]|nr:hypothetical protein [Chloroflexota bacterium]
MTPAALVFDLLLLAIVACFVPLGVWRGGAREACVTAGIGLGLAMAETFAMGWGSAASGAVGLDDGTGAAVVAVTLLWSWAALVGYAGAAVIVRRGFQPVAARLAGGVLAGLNGASLVGWSLTYVWRYPLDGDEARLDGLGPVTTVLMRHSDWLLAGSAMTLGLTIVAGLFWYGAARPVGWGDSPERDAAGDQRGVAGRSALPPRLPHSADRGKVEPRPEERPDWSAFRPVLARESPEERGDAGGAPDPHRPSGVEPRRPPGDEWSEPGPPRTGLVDAGPPSRPWQAPDRPAVPSRPGTSPYRSGPVPDGPARPPDRPTPNLTRPSSRPGEEVISEWLRRGSVTGEPGPQDDPNPPGAGDPGTDGDDAGDKPSATFPWLIERGDDRS